jgi:hypothetical protein
MKVELQIFYFRKVIIFYFFGFYIELVIYPTNLHTIEFWAYPPQTTQNRREKDISI